MCLWVRGSSITDVGVDAGASHRLRDAVSGGLTDPHLHHDLGVGHRTFVHTIGEFLLPGWLASFRTETPAPLRTHVEVINSHAVLAAVRDGEVYLLNAHISPYDPASRQNPDPYRSRKLLLHRQEINRLMGRVQEKGLTIIPLRVYLKKNRAKVEVALVRGKRQYDKREAIAKRDTEREIQRALKERE